MRASLGRGPTRATSTSLVDSLQALVTLNSGTVRSNESYAYFPIACQYLEPENVTSAQSSWGEGGSCAYLYRVDSPPAPPGSCNASAPEPGMDRPGGDFAATPLPTDSSAACEALCCAEDNCASWTYVPSAPAVFLGCAVGDHCCYQKGHTTPSPSSDPGIVSGTVARPLPSLSHPPAGMRSAVPLGGLGAGALELRADGTVHEVTIVNQSPAGAAKFGTLENLVVGVRANGVARALRTHAPPYAAGVDALTYSGAYPASRLRADDAGLAAAGVAVELVAFSKLSPGDVDASGLPAVVFSLLVTNNNNAAVNASAYVSLPWGGVNDCARPPVKGASAGTTVPAASAAACAAACAAAAGAPGRCGSWTFDPAAAGGAACVLVNDVAWSVYARGQTCGVSGAWGAPAAPGGGAPLSFSAGATHPASPASGGVTLRGVAEAARGGGAPPVPAAASYAVADDPAALWAAFAAAGALGGGAPGVTPAPFAPGAPGQVGAAAVTALVPAGATVALSVVFAWYFPHRDHMNVVVGNRYGGRFDSSDAVAAALASTPALSAAAADINALHAVFAGPLSPLPLYLQDAVINQMSHFRGMIATADGRFREFEAFDCPDVRRARGRASAHGASERAQPPRPLPPRLRARRRLLTSHPSPHCLCLRARRAFSPLPPPFRSTPSTTTTSGTFRTCGSSPSLSSPRSSRGATASRPTASSTSTWAPLGWGRSTSRAGASW